MNRYFGTEEQQKLQRKSDRLTEWIRRTPGACVTGRLMAADDWDELGWDVIRSHLSEDGAFGFRWATPEQAENVKTTLEDTGATVFGWGGFLGDAEALRPVVKAQLAPSLPEGFNAEKAKGSALNEMQAHLAAQGIAPLSTAVFGGDLWPARSLLIRDKAGNIAAAGFVGMLQNSFSLLADHAWLGLIGVSPRYRGLKLGSRITAGLTQLALDKLEAKKVIAFAASDNTASIGMLTGCGLLPRPEGAYVASLSGASPTR